MDMVIYRRIRRARGESNADERAGELAVGALQPPAALPRCGLDAGQNFRRGVHAPELRDGRLPGPYVWHGAYHIARAEETWDEANGTWCFKLFETEVKRKIRKEPATALELSQVPESDGLEEMWTFR